MSICSKIIIGILAVSILAAACLPWNVAAARREARAEAQRIMATDEAQAELAYRRSL